ncbi:uncharacterized protein [Malus domestica]|uniref:uncharacterized protein n=1 Tax=Malus domestica TaxID=3750 RepID=UPI0039762860
MQRVVATHNDLILCCRVRSFERRYERDYCICNPYTKQSIKLPPPPRVHDLTVRAGLICDNPYYNPTEDGCTTVKFNTEYRYRVVRIPQKCDDLSSFTVEMFSSETGEWREIVILCSPGSKFICVHHPCIALDGMLYWMDHNGRLFGFDPFNNMNSTIRATAKFVDDNELCRFIEFGDSPYIMDALCSYTLGVCRGRLRLFLQDESGENLFIWEWKEVEKQQGDINGVKLMEWCLIKTVSWEEMVPKDNPAIAKWLKEEKWSWTGMLVGDPNDGDVLYLHRKHDILLCNVRTKTWLWRTEPQSPNNYRSFQFSHRCWPTPIPRLHYS